MYLLQVILKVFGFIVLSIALLLVEIVKPFLRVILRIFGFVALSLVFLCLTVARFCLFIWDKLTC